MKEKEKMGTMIAKSEARLAYLKKKQYPFSVQRYCFFELYNDYLSPPLISEAERGKSPFSWNSAIFAANCVTAVCGFCCTFAPEFKTTFV